MAKVTVEIEDVIGQFEKYDVEIRRLREALRLGIEARNAQRAYFRERTQSNLVASKQAEKAFDDAARAALEGKE